MVSHPETGSDSPIGSDRDRGCDSTLDTTGLIQRQNLPDTGVPVGTTGLIQR